MMSINRVLPKEESRMKLKQQGIVAILNSENDKTKATFRRTLSADMSSKQWLSQNGILKRSVSSNAVSRPPIAAVAAPCSSSSDGEDEFTIQDRVWMSLSEMPKFNDWDSVLRCRQTDGNDSRLPPPYDHPPVKRSSSGLSEKSLEVCTESLGSETGSDCFSSEEFGGGEDRTKETNRVVELNARKYKESPRKPFPPPIPSIGGVDSSLRILSHRRHGRLVLEAVSIPPKKYFHAQRGDGRLILSLTNKDKDGFERVFDAREEIGEETDVGEGFAAKKGLRSEKTGTTTNIDELSEELRFTVPQFLPPQPRMMITPPAAASFNAYDYFWRREAAVSVGFISADHLKNRNPNNFYNGNNNKNGNEGYAYGGGCKEARRSISIWSPCCIATS